MFLSKGFVNECQNNTTGCFSQKVLLMNDKIIPLDVSLKTLC